MLRLRKILFYIFVLIYCLTCPVTILYALGYILKPGAERGIVKAGLIYLSTSPPGATVYVENRRFSEKTPTLIRGLLPGNYRVTVFLKNYRLWTREVSIEAEKAATFDKILLLPNVWTRETLLNEEFEDLIPVRSQRYLLLSKGDSPQDLLFYDLKEKEALAREICPHSLFDKKLYTVNEETDFEKKIFPREKFLFVGRRGEIFSDKIPFRLAGERVTGAEFGSQTQEILVWREDRLGVLDVSAGREDKVRWLVTGARKMGQAFWVHGESHILFRDADKLCLLPLLPGAEAQECFEVKAKSSIAYAEKSGSIFYLEKNSGKFCVTAFSGKKDGF